MVGDFKETCNPLSCYLMSLAMQLETCLKNKVSIHLHEWVHWALPLRTLVQPSLPRHDIWKTYIIQLANKIETNCFRTTPSLFLISHRSCYSRYHLQTKSMGISFAGSIPNLLNQNLHFDKNPIWFIYTYIKVWDALLWTIKDYTGVLLGRHNSQQ